MFSTLNLSHHPALTWEGVTRLGHGDKLELEVCVEVLVGELVVGGGELVLGRGRSTPSHQDWGEGGVGISLIQSLGGRDSLPGGRRYDSRRDVLHELESPL